MFDYYSAFIDIKMKSTVIFYYSVFIDIKMI